MFRDLATIIVFLILGGIGLAWLKYKVLRPWHKRQEERRRQQHISELEEENRMWDTLQQNLSKKDKV